MSKRGDKTIVPRADGDGFQLTPHDASADAPPERYTSNLDGFQNAITGVGDLTRDKTLGGKAFGPDFVVQFFSGAECENRWRGSDLGGRVVETLPDEMTREGWELTIQPSDEDDTAGAAEPNQRIDWPEAAPAAAPAPPGPLPEQEDDSQRVVEAITARCRELGVTSVVREALCYERAYGGAAILLGVDDGEIDLTKPLDVTRVRRIRHLTAFRGGWDGELIAWSYYNDPRRPRFGEPEIYMLRNLGVPIAKVPAPGATDPPPVMQPMTGPAGPLTFYVHESRLLIFPGTSVSRRARVQMRGWGDSVFMRVNEVLSQYNQTWSGVAILMQEWSQGVLKIEGLAELMASEDPSDQNQVVNRALMLQMTMSIARCRMLDASEEYKREVTPLSGIGDVLDQFAKRLAAAADIPVSLLMGQVQGGLGDASKGDIRFFYDRVAARQRDHLIPPLQRLYQILFCEKDSATHGVEPTRWTLEPRPLYQMTDQEEADLRNKQADTDTKYITAGVVTPEEVAASRFGGSKWSPDTVLDLDGRKELDRMYKEKEADKAKQAEAAKAAAPPPPAPGAPPAAAPTTPPAADPPPTPPPAAE